MKVTIGRAVAVVLLAGAFGVVADFFRPKYGWCPGSARRDEIACHIRRNLHFSAHFTWAMNRYTIEAVRPNITAADIPDLVALMGHERAAVRFAAGALIASFGAAAIAPLREAARSQDMRIRHTAEDALWTLENVKGIKAPPAP